MSRISKTNKVRLSSGEKISRTEFYRRISKAKAEKVQQQYAEHGRNFCEKQTEDCDWADEECRILDCSHNTSVKACVELGQAELAYDVRNITILGRKCHRVKDRLNLKFKK
jgi:hypothetical protein